MKKIKGIILISTLAVSIFIYGCGASNAVKGGVTGGVGGGVVGGVIGNQLGNTTPGVIIAAAVGGTTGALIGNYMDKQADEMKNDIAGAKIERVGEGMSNKEIGQRIRVSTYTVKSHIHNIMEKLALHTRLEIVNYSYSDEILKTISMSISMINN